jgi:hypothetical protein
MGDPVSIQNSILENQIKKLNEIYSTDEKKSSYIYEKHKKLDNINNFLLIVYYILAIVTVIILFIKRKLKYYFIIIISFFILIYPLIIKNIEKSIYGYMRFFYYLIKGEPYQYERK